MIELDCAVKNDTWGKLGSSSFVGQLLKSQLRTVNESIPYSELWMGMHQSGPSRVTHLSPHFDSKSIETLWKAWPEFVGNLDVTSKYGSNLPIFVKILSIDRPLPLQYSKDSKTDWGKIVIAIARASLLSGFRPHQQIIDYLRSVPFLQSLIDRSLLNGYVQSVSELHENKGPEETANRYLARCYRSVIETQQTAEHFLESIKTQVDKQTMDLLNSLHEKSLSIVGLTSFFFLNHLSLDPDQAIFIDSNQLHTFLSGNFIEVSNPNTCTLEASSGLVNNLDTLSVSPLEPELINSTGVDKSMKHYSHESSEIAIELVDANQPEESSFLSDYQLNGTHSGSFILVSGATETIVNNVYRVKPGQIFFVPPDLTLRFSHLRDNFRLYRFSIKS